MIASMLLMAAIASAPADDPAALIERLGAEAFDDRVAAYRALERLGIEALPALRASADSGDPRIRSRVRVLIDAIARRVVDDRFSRPIMIRLGYRDRPLGEVVEDLNDRYALGLVLGPEPWRRGRGGPAFLDPGLAGRQKELLGRKTTLEAPDPVPYWEAIDRLCEAGSLHYAASGRSPSGTHRGALALMGDRTGRGPVSDSGPFRVQVAGIGTVFRRDFLRGPDPARRGAEPAGVRELTVNLAVLAQPDLELLPGGPATVAEAIDDRGRSLIPDAPEPPDPTHRGLNQQILTLKGVEQTGIDANPPAPGPARRNRVFHLFTPNDIAFSGVAVKLAAPDPLGATLRRLRGRIPVVVVTRRPDPVAIRLEEGAAEKVISMPEVRLVVDEVSLGHGGRSSLRVTFRADPLGNSAGPGPSASRPGFVAFRQGRALDSLELVDATGRRLEYKPNRETNGADLKGFYNRFELTISPPRHDPPGGDGAEDSKAPVPAELRYYRSMQMATEVPFDFRDLPLR